MSETNVALDEDLGDLAGRLIEDSDAAGTA